MKNDTPNNKERLALLRFEVICHIKSQLGEGLVLSECLRAASSRPWPGEEGIYYSSRTLETWWYDYAKSGYRGLSGKSSRADAGKSRAVDEETGLWIIERIKENPGAPLQVLLRHWRSHGHQLPSNSSVYRYLKTQGYDKRSLRAGRLESGPQKAFEAPAPNDLWMVDFACGPTLRTSGGRVISPQLCVILDDHSRLIPFAAYYLSGDTASFLDCLKQAVLRRGLPLKLYTDQGRPFVNTHAKIVCANLGIRLLITQSSLSATGVLEILLSKLGEHPRFKRSANLLILEKHLADIDPLTLLLILDDAQNYPAFVLEEIRMLLGLGARQRAAFGLILLGDDYLLGSLRLSVQRALFSRISAAHQLQPLPREDIAPYLRWHLRRAGLDRDIFAQAATDLLAEASEGNPRTLNLLAQAAWLAAARLGKTSVETDHVHVALRQVPAATAKIASA